MDGSVLILSSHWSCVFMLQKGQDEWGLTVVACLCKAHRINKALNKLHHA